MSLALRQTEPQPAPDVHMQRLNRMRFQAIECRAKARVDVFEACALISTQSADAYTSALIRAFRSSTGHEPVFHAPGTKELSFDEKWLYQLFFCVDQGDLDSVNFLLKRRLTPYKQRAFYTLLRGVLTDQVKT